MSEVENLDVGTELKKNDFRVAIFGSARIKENDEVYGRIFELSKELGKRSYDVVTGGGPGAMKAANAGHVAGDTAEKAESIGLPITLPFEQLPNDYLEFKKEFNKFSDRLDLFMKLGSVFLVTPGGIGTMLELFYTWQLLQVKKMPYKPIILIGVMWKKLLRWIVANPIQEGLISKSDLQYIYYAESNEDALKLIDEFHSQFVKDKVCSPIHYINNNHHDA